MHLSMFSKHSLGWHFLRLNLPAWYGWVDLLSVPLLSLLSVYNSAIEILNNHLPGLNLTKLFYNSTFSSKRTWQLKSKMEKEINNWCLIDLAGIKSDSLLEQAWNYVIQFKKEMTNFPISINNLDLRCTVNASIQKKYKWFRPVNSLIVATP